MCSGLISLSLSMYLLFLNNEFALFSALYNENIFESELKVIFQAS